MLENFALVESSGNNMMQNLHIEYMTWNNKEIIFFVS